MDAEVAEGKAMMGRLQELTGDVVNEVTIALVISAMRIDAINEGHDTPDEVEATDIREHHEQLLSWERAGYATFAETPDD